MSAVPDKARRPPGHYDSLETGDDETRIALHVERTTKQIYIEIRHGGGTIAIGATSEAGKLIRQFLNGAYPS